MLARWSRGEFGNKLEMWESIEDFYAALDSGEWRTCDRVVIRSRDVDQPFCVYDILPWEVAGYVSSFVLEGADRKKLYLNSSECENRFLVIQGEVMRSHRGLELHYSTHPKKMRQALEIEARDAHGLAAKIVLETKLPPGDFDWIMELLDEYPDHVVEFSTWSVPYGTYPRCTIVWEVRSY